MLFEEARIQHPGRNTLLELHGGVGDVERGLAEADVVHEGTYETHRAQHAHLETHCTISWIDEAHRLNVRTSSQTPFLTKAKLCYLYSLPPDSVRVYCSRVRQCGCPTRGAAEECPSGTGQAGAGPLAAGGRAGAAA